MKPGSGLAALVLSLAANQAAAVGGVVMPPNLTPAQAQAFTQGASTFSESGAASSVLNSTQATTVVPSYATTNSLSSYYSGGNGQMTAPGAAMVSSCQGYTSTNQSSQQQCNAVNFISGQQPGNNTGGFTMNAQDPLVATGTAIANNPTAVVGSLSGTYSGCSTTSGTSPATYQTQTCTENAIQQNQTCQDVLNVTIQTQQVCTPGLPTQQTSFSFPDIWVGGSFTGATYTTSVTVSPICATPNFQISCNDSYWWTGARGASFTIDTTNQGNPNPTYAGFCLPAPENYTACYNSGKYSWYYSDTVLIYYSNLQCDSGGTCTANFQAVPVNPGSVYNYCNQWGANPSGPYGTFNTQPGSPPPLPPETGYQCPAGQTYYGSDPSGWVADPSGCGYYVGYQTFTQAGCYTVTAQVGGSCSPFGAFTTNGTATMTYQGAASYGLSVAYQWTQTFYPVSGAVQVPVSSWDDQCAQYEVLSQ